MNCLRDYENGDNNESRCSSALLKRLCGICFYFLYHFPVNCEPG